MGTLYYFKKCDDSRELFALNKIMSSLTDYGAGFFQRAVFHLEPEHAEDFAKLLFVPDQYEQALVLYERLLAWSQGELFIMIADWQACDLHHDLTYDEHLAKITGSVLDEAYEADGLTYIPGKGF